MTRAETLFRGYSTIPESVYHTPQWVCWRYRERPNGKAGKVPVSPETDDPADIRNPDEWTDLVDATIYHHRGKVVGYRDFVETETDGIGFVFTEDDPFVGIDLDDCVTTLGLKSWAREVVETLNCYTEYSPSLNGVHCICKGALPEGNVRSENVEMYESGRYFTVTAAPVAGDDIPETAPPRTEELAEIYDEYVATDEEAAEDSPAQPTAVPTGGGGNSLSDEEVRDRARAAANGEKFERLWTGSTEGYESHSEADLALCSFLAFWTGGDTEQMDRLFRRSGLMRRKWDEARGDQTYGELTLSKALEETEDFYDSE